MISSKRRAEDVVGDEGKPANSQSKRQRKHNAGGGSNKQKRPDVTYGQRALFGDLDKPTVPTSDDDLECEDDGDALAYLKSVRLQADELPRVLVASKAGPQLPSPANDDIDNGDDDDDDDYDDTNYEASFVDRGIYNDGVGDFRGYYEDGAYVAYPDGYFPDEGDGAYEAEDGGDPEGDLDQDGVNQGEFEGASPQSSYDGPYNSSSAEIHEAYHRALVAQYTSLRNLLHTTPPPAVVSSLSPNTHPTDVEAFSASNKSFQHWSSRLSRSDPLPAQIAAMHKDSVIRLLRVILGGSLFKKTKDKKTIMNERTSRWLWALLARLPEQGELGYQEIGWVRELGKRAVLFMVSLAEAEILHDQFGIVGRDGGGESEDDEVDVDVEETFEEEEDAEDERSSKNQTLDRPGGVRENDGMGFRQANLPQDPTHTNTDAEEEHTSDVEMDLDSDSEEVDAVEGSTEPEPITTGGPDATATEPTAQSIEAAKSRLLAQLATGPDDDDEDSNAMDSTGIPRDANANTAPTAGQGQAQAHTEAQLPSPPLLIEDSGDEENDTESSVVMNMRATLNMILTVAGEFYGQRDLLEFRDPFGRSYSR